MKLAAAAPVKLAAAAPVKLAAAAQAPARAVASKGVNTQGVGVATSRVNTQGGALSGAVNAREAVKAAAAAREAAKQTAEVDKVAAGGPVDDATAAAQGRPGPPQSTAAGRAAGAGSGGGTVRRGRGADLDRNLDRSSVGQEAARSIQVAWAGAKARRRPEIRPMSRVEILLKGRPGLHRGLVCWRGTLPDVPGVWLGVALDKPLGHNDGERHGLRCFKCEPKHGVFVSPSRVRKEGPKQVGSLSADFDLSSDETDGEGEAFEVSESDEPDEPDGPDGPDGGGAPGRGDETPTAGRGATGARAGAAGKAAGRGKAGRGEAGGGKAGGGEPVDPALQLALRIQNMVRGKKAREGTEYKKLAEQFTMPPVVSLDEAGRHHAIITIGHDSDRESGEWSVTVAAIEPVVIHHVVFDVGNDIRRPLLFRTIYEGLNAPPFRVHAPSGLLRDGDVLVIKGRDARRLKNGRPAESLKRTDTAWYNLEQRVTLIGLKGRAGEKIDLKAQAAPPCSASLLNPRVGLRPEEGATLTARVVVHFHRYFEHAPLALAHTIRFDGHGGASQHPITLQDPERKGGAPKTGPAYKKVVRGVVKVQRRWRRVVESRDVLHPTGVWSKEERAAQTMQAANRAASARAGYRVQASQSERQAAAQLGLETWGTLHPPNPNPNPSPNV